MNKELEKNKKNSNESKINYARSIWLGVILAIFMSEDSLPNPEQISEKSHKSQTQETTQQKSSDGSKLKIKHYPICKP